MFIDGGVTVFKATIRVFHHSWEKMTKWSKEVCPEGKKDFLGHGFFKFKLLRKTGSHTSDLP